MAKTEFYKLKAQVDQRTQQIQNINASVSENQRKMKQLSEDRRSALRTKDQAAANDAQFNFDALTVENADLEAKANALRGIKVDQAATDQAWKADLVENPAYKQELSLYKAAAALYDAVCVRAKNHYKEWQSFAGALTAMVQKNSFPALYAAPNPVGMLKAQGWNLATEAEFDKGATGDAALNSEAVDCLINLLQQIKTDGVNSVL